LNNRLRGILLLLIGFILIVAGIVAVYFLTRQSGLIQTAPQNPTPAVEITRNSVVVITHDMRLGDVIKAEDVVTVEVTSELLPRDYVSKIEEAVGKFIKTDLIQGEMLLQHNLADPTNKNGDLSYVLSDEHVLMAISFEDVMTKFSIPQRGDIVDIYITKSETVDVSSIPGVSGETSPVPDETTTDGTAQKAGRSFTFDSFQNLGITALVVDIVEQPEQNNAQQRLNEVTNPTPTPEVEIITRAYLFALKPQDALILKFLKDNGAIFDLVLRAPTSSQTFDLTPVTEEYIIELYGLEILK